MDYLPTWPLQFTPLLAFGVVLLVGALGGYVAHRVSWLPSITGFMLVGFLCGPSVLDLLSAQTIASSRVLIDIALAGELKLSLLFAPLVMGVVIKTLERKAVTSDIEFGSAFELFFIVLFVFAGAGLHLHELIQFAPAVLALVLVRCLTKVLGTTVMLRVFGKPLRSGTSSGLLLIPMAGLAIGLVQASSGLFPQQAPTIAAIILGAVTVFETLGPPVAAFAFRFAGEARGQDAEVGSEVQVEVAGAPQAALH